MIIQHWRDKIKVKQEGIFTACIVILVGVSCFGLGIMTEKSNLSSLETNKSASSDAVVIAGSIDEYEQMISSTNGVAALGGAYVASRNGTTYYPVGCEASERIKPENRIYFKTEEEALLAAYNRSTACES